VIIDLIGKDKIQNKEVGDLGSGVGAFLDYCLSEEIYPSKYIGYDIVEEPLNFARKHFDTIGIDNEWICSPKPLKKSDFIVTSGVFNVKLSSTDKEWECYIFNVLDSINKKSKCGFCFNLLTNKVDWKVATLFYADPYRFLDYCKKHYSKHVRLIENYGLYEWTILVIK
jgi:hypothetical protein